MGKSIGKLIFLTTAVLFSIYAVIWLPLLPKDGYLKAAILKHKRLQETPAPRLIFIGGSNLAFGLDSRLIQDAVGIPVVNMGLHNGLGLNYMINEIREKIRPGDVVVVVKEYPIDLDCTETLLEQILFFPQGARYIDLPSAMILARRFPRTMQRRFEGFLKDLLLPARSESYKSYSAYGFNEHGDNTGHLSFKKVKLAAIPLAISASVPEAVVVLNRFARELAAKGATLLLSFPPFPSSHFLPPQMKKARELHAWLQRHAAFALLGEPGDFVFPKHFFYDFVYHMNAKGRERRSRLLVEKLQAVLESKRSRSVSRTD